MITARDELIHVAEGLSPGEAEVFLHALELAEVCRALVELAADRGRGFDKELQDLAAEAREALGLPWAGSGSERGSLPSRPLRTARAPFRCMQLKPRTTCPCQTRGRPIGIADNLGTTTPEPATEMVSVAEAAPARTIAIPPTVLLCPLRRLADGSRPPTPRGSQPAFAWGDVATPIQPITGRHSLSPRSFTRSPIGSSYD
jgi:hypothetical protein